MKMLGLFGTTELMHATMDQTFLLFEPKSGEGNVGVREQR